MKRRIFSIILAALLLLPLSAAMAAGTPVTITSEDVRGNVGDTVTVAIDIAIEPPKLGQTMDSLQFVLEYDSAALEFVGIQELSQDRMKILGVEYVCNVTTKSGAAAFTAASADGASGSGVLMHVRFRIKSAVSTMLVLKKVSYSFVSSDGKTQKSYNTGGVVNLGRITGQSTPNTIAPYFTSAPVDTQEPAAVATDEPRFPVTEITPAPGTSPAPEPNDGESDILAYIVFGLFIVVAILICVVLTLMIVRRGRNKARIKYFEDDEDEEILEVPEEEGSESMDEILPEEEEQEAAEAAEEEEDDEPPIRIVRRVRKPEEEEEEQ